MKSYFETAYQLVTSTLHSQKHGEQAMSSREAICYLREGDIKLFAHIMIKQVLYLT